MQRRYWTPNSDEKWRLLEADPDTLSWNQKLRLLHLACMDMVSAAPGAIQLEVETCRDMNAPAGGDRDVIALLVDQFRTADSPFKPRHGALWFGNAGDSQGRDADSQGLIRNASLTHLGCLEVIRLDGNRQPVGLAFVHFDALRGAVFAEPAHYRRGKLFYDDGRPDEMVLAPLLYGISWASSHAYDQDGSMTRFICYLQTGDDQAWSIGIGQQDLVVDNGGDSLGLIGFGGISDISIGLSLDDPRFEQKCRARSINPQAVRNQFSAK